MEKELLIRNSNSDKNVNCNKYYLISSDVWYVYLKLAKLNAAYFEVVVSCIEQRCRF